MFNKDKVVVSNSGDSSSGSNSNLQMNAIIINDMGEIRE